MGWAFVQKTPASGTPAELDPGSPLTITAFGSAVTIGNFVVVWVGWTSLSGSLTVSDCTVSDNAATPNTYTRLPGTIVDNSGGEASAIFVGQINSNPSAGNLSPKVTNSHTSNAIMEGCAAEFSGGTTTTDGSSSNSGSTSNPSCGNMTTTVAGDLLLAHFALNVASGSSPTVTDPAGYTKVAEKLSGAAIGTSAVYQIATGTVTNNNPTWTHSGGTNFAWVATQAALQAAGGGGGGGAGPSLLPLLGCGRRDEPRFGRTYGRRRRAWEREVSGGR